jgi:hypothetical protein
MQPKNCFICRRPGAFLLANRPGQAPRRAACKTHLLAAVSRYAVVGSTQPSPGWRRPIPLAKPHIEHVFELLDGPIPSSVDTTSDLAMVDVEPGDLLSATLRSSKNA